MRIARRGLDLGVSEEFPDHRKALSEGQGARRKAVSQVMDSHVVEVRAGADAAPGVLEIGQMGARLPADDHPRVVVRTGKGREDVHRRAGERHHPRTGLAVAEMKLGRVEIGMLPAQGQDFVPAAAGEHQQTDRRHRFGGNAAALINQEPGASSGRRGGVALFGTSD